MTIDIKAPTFPESISDGTIAVWHHAAGEQVERDELLVDIETDKVVLEIIAPTAGQLSEILKNEGDLVLSEELIARFEEGAFSGQGAPSGQGAAEAGTAAAVADPVSDTPPHQPAAMPIFTISDSAVW